MPKVRAAIGKQQAVMMRVQMKVSQQQLANIQALNGISRWSSRELAVRLLDNAFIVAWEMSSLDKII